MTETQVDIPTPDGIADGVLFRPDDGSHPAIIDLPDISGLRPANLELSRRLASEGFVVLAVNPFYRTSRTPVMQPGEDRLQRMPVLIAPLTPEALERDGSAYVDFLERQEGVAKGKMGVVGHCYSGGVALRFAAARPDRIAAVASFHGGGLYSDSPVSPHLVLDRVKARLYFGHAHPDRSMPPEAVAGLERALREHGNDFESEVYEAGHGWTMSDRDVHDPPKAEKAFGKLTSLMKETLG